MKLTLTILRETYAISRLAPELPIPKWAIDGNFFSITKTDQELSIICLQDKVPLDVKAEKNWKAFKVEGPLDFSLVGVLADLSKILAQGGVSLSVVSTYDTDYIFVKQENLNKSTNLFLDAGQVVNTD